MGVSGPLDNLESRYRPIHGAFRAAMAAPAALPEFKGNVIAVETAPFWDQPLERVQKKYEQLRQQQRKLNKQVKQGKLSKNAADKQLKKFEADLLSADEIRLRQRAASNAAYHYYGCAKIMAQIGKAFAEATLEMQ